MTQDNSNDVQQALRDLRTKLEQTETDDLTRQETLARLKSSIDDAMETEDNNESLLERLNEAILHFETDHPALTAAINRAVSILSLGGV